LANDAGIATDLLDCVIDIFGRSVPAIGERDVAAIIEFFETKRT
jgi:hypothetical protein